MNSYSQIDAFSNNFSISPPKKKKKNNNIINNEKKCKIEIVTIIKVIVDNIISKFYKRFIKIIKEIIKN